MNALASFSLAMAAVAAVATGASAQEATAPATEVQALFESAGDGEAFAEALAAAEAAEVPKQVLAEAKLVSYLFRNPQPDKVKEILPELEALTADYDPDASPIFQSANAYRAIVAFAQSSIALEEGDEPGFKEHILEAIWLDPEQASMFSDKIAEHHNAKEMATLEVDLETTLLDEAGTETSLKKVLGDHKAVLMDFWASWCGPCVELMPELVKKAEQLKPHGIVVAGMNTDDTNAQQEAKEMKEKQGVTFPWLLDAAGSDAYQALFNINSIPRMVLLSADGKVHFNGHPNDPSLWTALQKIDPTIEAR